MGEAVSHLLNLCQEGKRVADYSIELQTVSVESRWNQNAAYDAYYHGLANDVRDELAAWELPAELDKLLTAASKRGADRKSDPAALSLTQMSLLLLVHLPPVSLLPTLPLLVLPNPLRTSRDQRSWAAPNSFRRSDASLCLDCGQSGHLDSDLVTGPFQTPSCPLQHAPLIFLDQLQVAVFIDSGADAGLMDKGLVVQLWLNLKLSLNS